MMVVQGDGILTLNIVTLRRGQSELIGSAHHPWKDGALQENAVTQR